MPGSELASQSLQASGAWGQRARAQGSQNQALVPLEDSGQVQKACEGCAFSLEQAQWARLS